MEPKWNRASTKTRKMHMTSENIVPKPWYQELGTRTAVLEPVPWNRRNRGFNTITGDELKNQYHTNITILSHLYDARKNPTASQDFKCVGDKHLLTAPSLTGRLFLSLVG